MRVLILCTFVFVFCFGFLFGISGTDGSYEDSLPQTTSDYRFSERQMHMMSEVSPYVARFIVKRMGNTAMVHDLLPIVGVGAYKKYNDAAYLFCEHWEFSRCAMGVMVGYIQEYGYTSDIVSRAAFTCAKHVTSKRMKEQCFSAAGSVIFWLGTYWYIESLLACDASFSDVTMQYFCYRGVSHENVIRDGRSLFGLDTYAWKHDDLYYPCNAIPERYQGACVYEQTYALVSFGIVDQKDIGTYCAVYTQDKVRRECIDGAHVQIQ